MLDFAWKGLVNIVAILWFLLNMLTLVSVCILGLAFMIDPSWLQNLLEVTCQK